MNPEPLRKTGDLPDHARAARARKRAEAEAIGIDDAFISGLVDRFYATIQSDSELGPIFARTVEDWPAHLDRLKQFWRSILHATGEYTGNPMRRHVAMAPLTSDQFSRWLTLFYASLRAMGAGEAAVELVGTRARMIADSLLTGIALHHHGITGIRAGAELPRP
jgi:hemoglobin